MAAGFWVEGGRWGRRDDAGMVIGERDSKGGGVGSGSGKGGRSSVSVSVNEEPLPVYEEVVKGSAGGGKSGVSGGVAIELREIRVGPEV